MCTILVLLQAFTTFCSVYKIDALFWDITCIFLQCAAAEF